MLKLTPTSDEMMRQNFRALEQEDRMNYKRNQDVEIGENSLIIRSPNGTRYAVTVSNAGVLSAVVMP